jgi:hypothetical protein
MSFLSGQGQKRNNNSSDPSLPRLTPATKERTFTFPFTKKKERKEFKKRKHGQERGVTLEIYLIHAPE